MHHATESQESKILWMLHVHYPSLKETQTHTQSCHITHRTKHLHTRPETTGGKVLIPIPIVPSCKENALGVCVYIPLGSRRRCGRHRVTEPAWEHDGRQVGVRWAVENLSYSLISPSKLYTPWNHPYSWLYCAQEKNYWDGEMKKRTQNEEKESDWIRGHGNRRKKLKKQEMKR